MTGAGMPGEDEPARKVGEDRAGERIEDGDRGEDGSPDRIEGSPPGRAEGVVTPGAVVAEELGSMPGRRPGPLRRLYDWVLHWADTPHGPRALGALSFAESSFFPIPPDPLLVALCLGAPRKAFRFAAICTGWSVLGGLLGYLIGAAFWGVADTFFYAWVPGVDPEAFTRVQALYDRYDFWAVFLAGLTPIPYKVFTLSSGVFGINVGVFALASVLSRGLRFTVVAALIHRFGPPVAAFIDRYFDILAVLFGVLLVGGFLVVELLL